MDAWKRRLGPPAEVRAWTSFPRKLPPVGSQKRCLCHPRKIKDVDIFFETTACLSSQKRCPWP
ncbi:hydrogenase [Burkholderia pseudomallei MSHR6137]|nr:hydrogenase [Burkholderia pseudomallei MSHR6137]